MLFIGLAGPAGVGKDSVADYLVEQHGFTKFSFSDAIYREVSKAFGFPEHELRDRETKERDNPRLTIQHCRDGEFASLLMSRGWHFHDWLSPRLVLQRWGTDYRRAADPAYWIKQAALYVKAWLEASRTSAGDHRGLVNSSVRFENERAFIRTMNGVLWHIRRKAAPQLAADTATYVSEVPLDIRPGESVLHNDYTLAHLGTATSLLLQAEPGAVIRCEPPPKQFTVTCDKCGWVHMAYTRAQAIVEVESFNAFYEMLTQERKDELYGGHGSSIEQYEQCHRCGGKTFHVSGPNDCPVGSTIGPVIFEAS